MKRLRHPITSLREPFGKAGLIVAIVALVAAIGGTALAASKLNSTQKKEVEKIAKKFAGKNGANGTNGTNGSPGAPGAKGDAGAAGSNGSNGTNGKNVVLTNITTAGLEGKCAGAGAEGKGGTKVEVEGEAASKKYICNGKNGAIQPHETLPSGASETGVWSIPYLAKAVTALQDLAPISFPIPLKEPLANETQVLAGEHVHIFEGSTAPTGCTLGEGGFLEAAQGNLCIKIENAAGISAAELYPVNPEQVPTTEIGVGRDGAMLTAGISGAAQNSFAHGTWAVTAP